MNFNIDFSKWVIKMLEKYENSPKARQLIHMILAIFSIYALASLLQGIGAVKWW